MTSFLTTRAHVPGFFLNLSLDREPAFIRTCARRWLAHGSTTNTRTQPATQSVAAKLLPVGNGRLREPVEHGGPSQMLRAPAFLPIKRRDICRSGILKFSRTILAAGKPSFFPRINLCQEPPRGLFYRFVFTPVLCLLSLHADQLSMEQSVWRAEKISISSRKHQ